MGSMWLHAATPADPVATHLAQLRLHLALLAAQRRQPRLQVLAVRVAGDLAARHIAQLSLQAQRTGRGRGA